MSEEHSSPIKNWKQLLAVVVLAFLIPIILIAFVTQIVTGQLQGPSPDDKSVADRIKPVGSFVVAEAGAAPGQQSGEQVYGAVCKSCHDAGLAGAPKLGDKAAWSARIAQGERTVVEHAIKGIRAMPAKGGNPALTDDEVHRAVAYMANTVGANWKAPAPAAGAAVAEQAKPASAAAPAASAAPRTPPAASVAAAAAPATGTGNATSAASAKPDGKKVYDTVCMACHATGVAGAPKTGDKAAWAPRIKLGLDALHASAIKGKGAMPPKGGNTALPDADVKAAVDYMVNASK